MQCHREIMLWLLIRLTFRYTCNWKSVCDSCVQLQFDCVRFVSFSLYGSVRLDAAFGHTVTLYVTKSLLIFHSFQTIKFTLSTKWPLPRRKTFNGIAAICISLRTAATEYLTFSKLLIDTNSIEMRYRYCCCCCWIEKSFNCEPKRNHH